MITILNAVSAAQWLRLLGALILFQGLGFGLLSFYSPAREWRWTQRCAATLALSIALWAALMPWLSLAGLHLSPLLMAIIPVLGWLIAALRADWAALRIRSFDRATWADAALWLVVVVSGLLSLAALEGLAVGPSIDSYHHTLIAQLFVDNGGLPLNYEPYAPLITFSYHFGFHSVVGVLSTLSGIRTLSLVPIMGQLLQAGVAFTTAFWAGTFFQPPQPQRAINPAPVVAALVCGLACALPAAMGNWARYTQLTGLVLLPILLALFWLWLDRRMPGQGIVILAVLIVGLALSHYRVTIMAGLGMITLYIAWKIRQRERLPTWREVTRVSGLVGLIALLYGPWLYRTILSRQVGFGFVAADESDQFSTFFDLQRLGPWTMTHPTNVWLIGLVALALVIALARRNIQVIALAVWSALMMVLSSEQFLGQYMDTITVFISLYIPGSLAIAWLAAEAWQRAASLTPRLQSGLKLVAASALVLIAAQGAWVNRAAIQQDNVWVHKDDLAVAGWISTHTPADARILGNTFRFAYNPRWVLGQDAAYWFPLLAHRATPAMPMIYSIERSATPDLEQPMMQIAETNGQLTSPEGLAALQAAGVQYIFIGTRGGAIQRPLLDASPHFKLAFAAGSAAVYQFMDASPS